MDRYHLRMTQLTRVEATEGRNVFYNVETIYSYALYFYDCVYFVGAITAPIISGILAF